MDNIIYNQSDKPNNIIESEEKLTLLAESLENELPVFLKTYFIYLKGNVLVKTRVEYLRDLKKFFNYLIKEKIVEKENIVDISIEHLNKITAKDVNFYIDYMRRYKIYKKGKTIIYQNENRALARKRSSLSVFFKFLYREEMLKNNITLSFNPIRLPKPTDKEIKALTDDETMKMLDIVKTGDGLSKKQKIFFEKTKKRDRAILIFFLTFGLRITELRELNISSFNFSRNEFQIFRKRGKEITLPLNKSTIKALYEYTENERNLVEIYDEKEKDALFLSLQGKRLAERQIREIVKKWTSFVLGTSQKKGYSPHKLRATTATSLIERGESIFDVQALLNHENLQTTQLYAMHRKHAARDLIKNLEWEDEFDE
ncbi:MAG: tyrosine-type recombinase/integrase [Clostridiales Family XIII bacterium]|jgi:site-specific recombinase XerD|nr:tyrosine-type recombinase/integrase [Clostridiales Family XIII bacterium]